MTREGLVKTKVKKILATHGANVKYVMPLGAGYGTAGASDFVVCAYGRFVAIETKAGYGKTTPLQEKFLRDVEAAGGIGLVIREDTLDLLEQTLQGLRDGK